MSADHLTQRTLSSFVDGELTREEQTLAQAHLTICHACSLAILAAQQLKGAVRQPALRYTPSPAAFERLSSVTKQKPPKQVRTVPLRTAIWSAVAAALLVAVTFAGWQQSNRHNSLAANLLDQHLASLSDASTPQVISTDRHTVKPWFQGKLPFSFNLPEPNALPPETVLEGADFTYVQGKPAAQLLFLIRKHHASVFVTQAGAVSLPGMPTARSGFHVSFARAGGLDLAGISDVNRPELDALLAALAKVQ
jgi:anti-sigma factor RsiW